jgi:hypothetical protein
MTITKQKIFSGLILVGYVAAIAKFMTISFGPLGLLVGMVITIVVLWFGSKMLELEKA